MTLVAEESPLQGRSIISVDNDIGLGNVKGVRTREFGVGVRTGEANCVGIVIGINDVQANPYGRFMIQDAAFKTLEGKPFNIVIQIFEN